MEFGKVEAALLPDVDFALPADGNNSTKLLKGKLDEDFKLFAGCAKWGRKDWIGKIYPKGTKEANFLDAYGNHFNSIELNATHYSIYPETAIRKWADKVKQRPFKFCPKVPQVISHYTDLSSAKATELTKEFLNGIYAFGECLGPVFLQVSDKYTPNRRAQLFQYIANWPKGVPLCVEVRHASWFSDLAIRHELWAVLQENNCGWVITDTAGRRDCVHMEYTVPSVLIRFVGNNLHASDYSRVDAWIARMQAWKEKGMKEIYFFMHQPEEEFSPELSYYLAQEINAKMGFNLPVPQLISDRLF